jgi:ElaB/YqjD/DUF883 family membrane-anchored ribosome-binding protein
MQKTKIKRVRSAQNDLYNDLTKIKAALADATSSVSGRTGNLISHQLNNVVGKTTDFQDEVEDFVVEKPLKAISIAVFTGLVIGLILRK